MNFEVSDFKDDEKAEDEIGGKIQSEKRCDLIREGYDGIPNTDIKINRHSRSQENVINYPEMYYVQEGEDVMVCSKFGKNKFITGRYVKGEVDGEGVNLVFDKGEKPIAEVASYIPEFNMYNIGPKMKDLLENNPEVFLTAIFHEIQHDKYLSLNEFQQKRINKLFLTDEVLRSVLEKFITFLYDIDEKTFANEEKRAVYRSHFNKLGHCVIGDKKGIKDASGFEFECGGKKVEVLISSLVTELISYTAMTMLNMDEYCSVAKKNMPGVSRINDIASICYEYINGSQDLKSVFEDNYLFKRDKELERFIITSCIDNYKD